MPTPKLRLKLYVQASDSGRALSQLYKALEFHDYSDYQLTIIDVKQEPELAQQDGITRTPAVVYLDGEGKKIASSEFADPEKLRVVFGFKRSR